MTNPDSEAYRKAAKRVKNKKEFYKHFGTYAVMGIFFFLLNAVTAWGHWWFYWPMLGWGIGVLFHYLEAFGLPGAENIDEPDWEEQAIQEELRKMGYPRRSRSRKEFEEDPLDLPEIRKEEVLRRRGRWDEDELV